jgi:uncharacterized delta-60 repeat protein
LDPTFGSGGFVVTTAASAFHDVALAADGSIVVAGNALYTGADGNPTHRQMAVGHLTANGAMDTTFGTAGTGISAVPPISVTGSDDANALAIGPDGRIVVAGWTGAGSTQQALFARFTASAASPSPVQIGSLTESATTVTAGSPVTLTAGAITTTNAGATITQVAFYSVDSSGAEQLLGYGTANANGTWTLTFTANLTPGSYKLLALAVDSTGAVSDPFTLALTVQ